MRMKWLMAGMVTIGMVVKWADSQSAPPPGAAAPASEPAAPSTRSGIGLSHIKMDVQNKRIRVECEALNPDMPLEFFCVTKGGNEYESALRTEARPSQIHFALLALGLTPGEPAHYVEATKKWFSPTGPGLQISCEFEVNGHARTVPANRLLRSTKTKREMPPMQWVFDGSRVLPDGQYAADITGYVVSIVNFDLTLIDVPELASNANETLEWEYNPEVCPKKGAPITMIIEPVKDASTHPAESKSGVDFNPGPGLGGGGR